MKPEIGANIKEGMEQIAVKPFSPGQLSEAADSMKASIESVKQMRESSKSAGQVGIICSLEHNEVYCLEGSKFHAEMYAEMVASGRCYGTIYDTIYIKHHDFRLLILEAPFIREWNLEDILARYKCQQQ